MLGETIWFFLVQEYYKNYFQHKVKDVLTGHAVDNIKEIIRLSLYSKVQGNYTCMVFTMSKVMIRVIFLKIIDCYTQFVYCVRTSTACTSLQGILP